MFVLQKSSKRASARSQIDIKGVKDGILKLPRRRYRMVLSVSPINFELKSEDEQDAIIETYESFLNSVGSPLEILIRTREIDMDKYLGELDARLAGETETIYRNQLSSYSEFIHGLIATNKILTRHFYVIVPYNSPGKVDFEAVQEQLKLKVDIVQKGLARLSVQSRELSSLEVLDLFYSFYSPEQAKIQPLRAQLLELLHAGYIQKGASSE